LKILRWIAVIPIAILAFILSGLFTYLAINILPANPYVEILVLQIIIPALASIVFIYTGIYLAPCFKKETAIVLTFLICAVFCVTLFDIYFVNYDYAATIKPLAGIIGAIMYCIQFYTTGVNKIDLNDL